MAEDDAVELADDVFRFELKANRKVDELFEEYGEDEAVDAMIESFKTIMENSDNAITKGKAVRLMRTFAQGATSDRMDNVALKVAKKDPDLQIQDVQ